MTHHTVLADTIHASLDSTAFAEESAMTTRPPDVLAPLLALVLAGCAGAPAPKTPALIDTARSPVTGVFVTGRIAGGDIAALGDAGIRRVVDLTPDAETPDFDEASAVGAAGLVYANLPLRGAGDLTRENVRAFDALMRDATQPVLVHCASGNRVGAMAALRAAWIDGKGAEDAVAIGKAWGLTGLEDEVRRRIAASHAQ